MSKLRPLSLISVTKAFKNGLNFDISANFIQQNVSSSLNELLSMWKLLPIVARYVHFLFKTFELIMTRFDLVSSGDKKNVRGMS